MRFQLPDFLTPFDIPIVLWRLLSKQLSVNWSNIEDFPTPASPINKILKIWSKLSSTDDIVVRLN
jgi:hypothetical protein